MLSFQKLDVYQRAIQFLALPYALTLVVLAFGSKRVRAPAADGVPYDPEGRG